MEELTCRTAPRTAESSFALAILTLVVVLARATMLHLRYLPRYATALYDLLLSTLWLLNLAQRVSSSSATLPAAAGTCRGPGGDSTDGCRTAAAATRSVICALAVTLYGGRLVWDVVVLWSGARGSRGVGVASSASLDGGGYRDVEAPDLSAADEVYRAALSPVLAFFPDDMHDKTPWHGREGASR